MVGGRKREREGERELHSLKLFGLAYANMQS